jgi:hypothetical protein
MRQLNFRLRFLGLAALAAAFSLIAAEAGAQLLVYEPFDYAVGQNLGGTDPDGPGPTAGDPNAGQTGTYAAGGGGGPYKWRAHGTVSNYQAPNDTVISAGSLSYPGLALSQGNSVSYGSHLETNALYADAISLPNPVNSGSLYASFIIRIKSTVAGTQTRFAPAAFLAESTGDMNAGGALASQGGTTIPEPGVFWMRKDPTAPNTTNFSPGKTQNDGIGPGALGDSTGWQNSSAASTEANQFGAKTGQPAPDFATPSTHQTYFVVLKHEFSQSDASSDDFDPPGSTPGANLQSHTVSLWMNPGPGTLGVANGEILASQDPTGSVGSYFAAVDAYGTATPDSTIINTFALFGHRQNTMGTAAVDFDELRIGLTWADVTPASPAGVPGDYNANGNVDAADYVLWRNGGPLANEVDAPGTVNAADYDAWRARFGNAAGTGTNVPEPLLGTLLAAGSLVSALSRRRWW